MTKKHLNYLPWIHTRFTQIISCILFLTSVATIQCEIYSGQEPQKHSLQFIFRTHLWLWNKVKVNKPKTKMQTPRKVMIMQILKDLTLKVSGEKEILSLKLFVKRGNMSIISLEHAWKKKNCGIFSYFTGRNQKLHRGSTYADNNIKFSVKTVWHCYGFDIKSWSLKVPWMGKARRVLS